MRVLQSTPHVLKQELQQEGMGEICPKGVRGGGGVRGFLLCHNES